MPQNAMKIGGGIIAAILAACLVLALLTKPEAFEHWYDDTDAQNADWKLMVTYSVAGFQDQREYVAHYRRRSAPRFQEKSWTFSDDSGITVEHFENWGANELHLSMFACGGKGGFSEYVNIHPTATEQGVNLEIDLKRHGGDRPFQASTTIAVPFRKEVSGRGGRIDYRARWQRLRNDT